MRSKVNRYHKYLELFEVMTDTGKRLNGSYASM
jgi:hypothetical protein